MTTLSPSTINLYKDCPRCFWLHINKKLKRPDTPFPSLPSGMDRVLKEHFDNFAKDGKLPPELQELNGEVTLFDDFNLLKTWRNNLRGIRWEENDVVLHGAVDNILKKDNKLIVLDYKTRGFPLKEDTHEHYRDQLDLYNFLLRKNGYETEDYAYLLFYHSQKVNATGEVVFHTDLMKIAVSVTHAEELLKNAVACLRSELPPPSKNCAFCGWKPFA